MDLLSLLGVRVGYHRRPLLPPVDLVVRRGTSLGIVGPNGSGKSTLLRTMLALLPPVAGSLVYPLGRPPRFGYVPQRAEADRSFPMTALDLVVMGRLRPGRLGPGSVRADRAAARDALARVDLIDHALLPLATLSGGQRQRALLARAIVTEPDVLVLDEPTTGMDLVAERALLDLVEQLRVEFDLAIVIVTHHLALVANSVSEVLLVDRERQLVDHGPVDQVVTSERLSALYGMGVVVGELHGRRVVFVDRRKEQRP